MESFSFFPLCFSIFNLVNALNLIMTQEKYAWTSEVQHALSPAASRGYRVSSCGWTMLAAFGFRGLKWST